MKARKTLPLLLAALALTACKYDDSALWEQFDQNKEYIAASERIAALETWQAKTNTNIQSTQALLGTDDCITAVTPVTEAGMKVGYTITFLNSPAITIYNDENGVEGITPQIGVTQEEDGKWYWTLNGDLLTDGEGNVIQANGDSAPVPQLSTGASLTVSQDSEGAAIVADAIYLSVDDGKTWTRVSGEDGRSFFSDVDISDPTCVTFTLSDGTSFSIARYTGLKLTFDRSTVRLGYGNTITVDFTAEGSEAFTTDNIFIVAPEGWEVTTSVTRAAATNFSLTITAPSEDSDGEILVMLDNQQGNTTIGRIKTDCKDTYLVMHEVSAGGLVTAIGDRTDLTSITVTSGTLDETDWAAVVKNNAALLYLDLEGTDYMGTDANNLEYSVQASIINVKLPQGITGLKDYAFDFCDQMTSITLPEGLTSIGEYAFRVCGLTSITIPSTVTKIPDYTFQSCSDLTTVTCLPVVPPEITVIPPYTSMNPFPNCSALTAIYVPAEAVEAYQAAAGWSEHADIIQAIP